MTLYQGSNQISSSVKVAQFVDATDIMKHMTVEIGDVGQVMLPLNENENRRRYLNGQIILQSQFTRFTDKLKQAANLYPSLVCTEEEWQQLRLTNIDDQCGKFVIDDVNGTIRLPRIKYLVGNLNLYHLADGIPNRRLIKTKRITDADRSWYNIYSDGYCEQGAWFNLSESETFYTYQIPFISMPHLVIGRSRSGRNSVTTNTDFMGTWTPGTTGFRSWGNWNGFNLSYTATGYVNIDKINTQYTGTKDQFESPYYIQVSTGVDYEVDVVNKITTNTPYSFGMYTRSIGNLNNASWLKSDGSYHSGTIYTGLYQWILQNYNGARNDGIEVVLKNTSYRWYQDTNTNFKGWTPKRNVAIGDPIYGYGWYNDNTSDICGFVTSITDASHISFFNVRTQSTVNLVYETIDTDRRPTTDYAYVIDTANQTFRLPLVVGDEMVPDYKGDKLFDIQHLPTYIRNDNHHYFIAPCNGYAIIQIDRESTSGNTPQYSVNGIAMQYGPFWVANYINWNIPLRKGDILRVWSDLADNKFEYGRKWFVKCTNMQPLYFYAGETIQNANLINAGKLAESMAQLSALSTRYIVEKWESGNQFRILYNDGWCEQGGEVYVNGEVSVTVTYPKPYADNNYNLTLGWNSTADDRNNDCSNGNNKNATGFVAYGKTSAGYMSWRAVGYIATK